MIQIRRVAPADLLDYCEGSGGSSSMSAVLSSHMTDPFDIPRTVIHSVELLADATEALDQVLTQRPEKLVLDVLNRAYDSYSGHDYSQALLDSWTVSETVFRQIWHAYLGSSVGNIEAIRRGEPLERMTTMRHKALGSWDANQVIEVLELHGVIGHELFRDLHGSRSARNKWIHSMKRCTDGQAKLGIEAATQLVNQHLGTNLRLAPTWVL